MRGLRAISEAVAEPRKNSHYRGHRGTQRRISATLCDSWWRCYFGLGAILSALLGCLAMIMSLILS